MKRVQERLEGRGHDEVDEEDGQQQREAQAAEADLHLAVLAADLRGDARGGGLRRSTASTSRTRGARGRGPCMFAVMTAARCCCRRWISAGPRSSRTSATESSRIGAPVRARAGRGCARRRACARSTPRLRSAHVDLPVLFLEARRHHALDAVAQRLGQLPHVEAERGQPLAVEDDLQLGVARLQRRAHVHQARAPRPASLPARASSRAARRGPRRRARPRPAS